jgi:inorganic phosphate transporter, PiT family
MELGLLVAIVIIALAFDYTNGFHDTANAIATCVSTRALSPRLAVLMAAVFNLAGAFFSTAVAKTIGEGIVDTAAVTQTVVLAALIGAIVWNIITWRLGLPSSSSHALIGGLIGATIINAGLNGVIWSGVVFKVLLPMFLSPVLGFIVARILMTLLLWIVQSRNPVRVNKSFRTLQWGSSAFVAFSHGSNDAQKTMGIITLALLSAGQIKTFAVPFWVILAAATAMAAGTYSGGWRIIKTLGSRVIKLDPIHGFAAQTSAAAVILSSAHFGLPISTTQAITATIMGAGSTQRVKAVRWGVVGDIFSGWLFTLPASAAVGAVMFLLVDWIF